MMKIRRLNPGLVAICLSVGAVAGETPADPGPAPAGQADIRTWETAVGGVHLSLTQILPDQLRAFYVNRGMPLEVVEPYATSCVFMTVVRNDNAEGVVRYELADWSIESGGKVKRPPDADQWLRRLGGERLAKAARVAFRWAQFPQQQEYQPGGDWNQGMLSMDLPARSRFTLVAQWETAGQTYQGVLNDVVCAN